MLISLTLRSHRFDYAPIPGLLEIRVTSPIHESFVDSLTEEIKLKLKAIAAGSPPACRGNPPSDRVRDFARSLVSAGSSRIRYRSSNAGGDENNNLQPQLARQQPDGQFLTPGTKFPGLVFEVAYSQTPRKLKKKAERYMDGSEGKIQTVLGINIPYGDGKEPATVSLWKAVDVVEDGIAPGTVFDMAEVVSFEVRLSSPTSPCRKTRRSDRA